MKVLTMIIWTFLSWTFSRDGRSSSHVISPPTRLDLLSLSRGYQRISKDTRGYQYNTCDGRSSFPGLPPATHPDLVALKRRSGTPKRHQRTPEDYQSIQTFKNFSRWGVQLSWPFSSYPSSPPPQRSRLPSSTRVPPLLRSPRYSRLQT